MMMWNLVSSFLIYVSLGVDTELLLGFTLNIYKTDEPLYTQESVEFFVIYALFWGFYHFDGDG